jgi:hypothetical protein
MSSSGTPAAPRSFILCLRDRSLPRWLPDAVANRLGVEQLTIDTSHSPFLRRPRELAELLVHATTTRPIGPRRPDSFTVSNSGVAQASS